MAPTTRGDLEPDTRVVGTTGLTGCATRSMPDLYHLFGGRGGDITIKVNDKFVEKGTHEDEALALLGIDRNELDRIWGLWIYQKHGGTPKISSAMPGGGPIDEFATYHQAGAGWEVNAVVDAPQQLTVEDLAYVDLREIRRTVTLRMRQWNYLTDSQLSLNHYDTSAGRTSQLVEFTQDLDKAASVGSWYSGVNQDDIEKTAKTAHALESARRHCEQAVEEIDIALRVADAAWKGDRADAAKYKFCLESQVLEAIRDATHDWEDFVQDVVRNQQLAKHQDEVLRNEVLAELAIDIVVGSLTFGVGGAVRGAGFLAKLGKWGNELAKFKRTIEAVHDAAFARMEERLGSVWAVRTLRQGARNAAHTTAVNAAGGQDTTMNDWLMSFVYAGAGHAAGALGGLGKGKIADRYHIHFDQTLDDDAATFFSHDPHGPAGGRTATSATNHAGTGTGTGHSPGSGGGTRPPTAGGGGRGPVVPPPVKPPAGRDPLEPAWGKPNDAGFESIDKRQAAEVVKRVDIRFGWRPPRNGISYGTTEVVVTPTETFSRPTGVMVTITPSMLGTGSAASAALSPAGYLAKYRHNIGHLLARRLGGPGDDPRNLVTLTSKANNGAMRTMEAKVAAMLQKGDDVAYTVIPLYDGDAKIPREVILRATSSSGETFAVRIFNLP